MLKSHLGDETRVVIIDDHAMVGMGLKMVLEECGHCVVIAQANCESEALCVAQRNPCDVILLDLDLAGQDGSKLIAPLLKLQPQAQILILASQNEIGAARHVVALGARGIIMKEHSGHTLVKAVTCVHRGELWMDRSTVASLVTDLHRGETSNSDPDAFKAASLTAREREVIELLSEGLKNKTIARRLFLSETTVRHHLTSIFAKLEVTDRLELVIYAFRHGLIQPIEPPKK